MNRVLYKRHKVFVGLTDTGQNLQRLCKVWTIKHKWVTKYKERDFLQWIHLIVNKIIRVFRECGNLREILRRKVILLHSEIGCDMKLGKELRLRSFMQEPCNPMGKCRSLTIAKRYERDLCLLERSVELSCPLNELIAILVKLITICDLTSNPL